jgi:hypothetical protein
MSYHSNPVFKDWDEGWEPEDYERWEEFIKNPPPLPPDAAQAKDLPEISPEVFREMIRKAKERNNI